MLNFPNLEKAISSFYLAKKLGFIGMKEARINAASFNITLNGKLNYYLMPRIVCIHTAKGWMIVIYPPYAQTKVPKIARPTPRISDLSSSRTSILACFRFASTILLYSSSVSGGPVTPLLEETSASWLDNFLSVVYFIVYKSPKTEMIAPELANRFISFKACPKAKLRIQKTTNKKSEVFAPKVFSNNSLNLFMFFKVPSQRILQGSIDFKIFYCFGSIPRCCSSLRIILFSHAAKDSSPSCCCACSIMSRNSGSSRNWNGGLPRLWLLCVDTSITPDVMCLCVMTHYTQKVKKTTPRGAVTLSGRLTKTLAEVTLWLALSLPKHALNLHGVFSPWVNSQIRSSMLLLPPSTKHAKKTPAGCVCILACRFRVEEVQHV